MMYGQLIDGNIIPVPNPLMAARSRVYNPSAEQYAALGCPLRVMQIFRAHALFTSYFSFPYRVTGA